jgi:hypothetical protein
MGQAKIRKLNGTYGTPKVSPLKSVPPKPEPSIVWHYTVGAAIKQIHSDGELHLSTMAQGREKSILWFSANPDWEPSAVKTILLNSRKIPLDKTGTEQLYGGLYRIAVSSSLLISWAEMKQAYKPESVEILEDAKRFGANPLDWWCSPSKVRSEHWMATERFSDGWQELRQDEIPESHLPTTSDILTFLESRNIDVFQLLSNPLLFINKRST